MYIYGITIGMDFRDVAKILMSPTGSLVTSLLDGDVFTGKKETISPVNIFEYFDKFPNDILSKYDVNRDLNGDDIVNPLIIFKKVFKERYGISKKTPIGKAINDIVKTHKDLSIRLNQLESLRSKYTSNSKYGQRMFNQLIDSVQEYFVNLNNVDKNVLTDLKTLAGGAAELKLLGRIYSFNQGIKTDPEGLLGQVKLIERCVYDITGKDEDLIDIKKFAFDEDYRNQAIEKYESVKHTFNILDAVAKVPHFMSYVEALATALQEVEQSFKFRSSRNMSLELSRKIKYKDESKIIKGVENYVGDFLRKQWFLQNGIRVKIPKGNTAFDSDGNKYTLKEDTTVSLGTDWGAATFRSFVESQVIPDLQEGRIKPNVEFPGVKDNKFIRDLVNDITTNTVSKNASIIYTLPINMLPRTPSDTNILNGYKAEFNKLAKYSYQYETDSFNIDGQVQTNLNSIPLVDLFTYYAMIANNWKLSENSLVPILENFQNTGIIKDFHDFEKAYDKSGETLSMGNTPFDDILPYIIPKGSPYSSYSNYIWSRNKDTHKYEIMHKASQSELDSIQEDENGNKPGVYGRYLFDGSKDTNYFPTGRIQSAERIVNLNYKDDEGKTVHYQITYDTETGIIKNLKSGMKDILTYDTKTGTFKSPKSETKDIDLTGFHMVPTIKVNGIQKLDTFILESFVKSKLNPC